MGDGAFHNLSDAGAAAVPRTGDIKHVPQEAAARRSIRLAAAELASRRGLRPPLHRLQLETEARLILDDLSIPHRHLGFAMVAVSNAAWLSAFAAVPFHRRLLLLPHCLSSRSACRGLYGSAGLQCADCGSCAISGLQSHARRLGYEVIVAEGTSPVLERVLDGRADALLGVACMDSLARSFARIGELGIPQLAVPLLRDGCLDTVPELDYLESLLRLRGGQAQPPARSFVPLLRGTSRLFHDPDFSRLIEPVVQPESLEAGGDGSAMSFVEREALLWLRQGGKRLRPFLTVASHAVAQHGLAGMNQRDRVPDAVGRLALAIEALHKASLVHDDIEDNDEFRYGRQALHIRYGLGPAINIGDYLIGLGYCLATAAGRQVDPACAGDLVGRLAQAHQDLCQGQGSELLWRSRGQRLQSPLEILTAYALKTSPAFEAAIYCGLRCQGPSAPIAEDALSRMCTALGQAFQIDNDLEDWVADEGNKVAVAKDALCDRPTILRAFAVEAGFASALSAAQADLHRAPEQDRGEIVGRIRDIYIRSGTFERAEQLLGKLRHRALQAAGEFPTPDLRELMQFVIGLVLPARNWAEMLS